MKNDSGYTKAMVVVAHPDDDILGCGGTIKRLTKLKKKVNQNWAVKPISA